MEILAHLVTHRHIGNAEDGESKIEEQRTGHEIGEIELQRVLTVQLPHHAVSDSEKNCSDENVGASAAPFRSCVIRDKTHDRVRNGIESPRSKIDQTPQ